MCGSVGSFAADWQNIEPRLLQEALLFSCKKSQDILCWTGSTFCIPNIDHCSANALKCPSNLIWNWPKKEAKKSKFWSQERLMSNWKQSAAANCHQHKLPFPFQLTNFLRSCFLCMSRVNISVPNLLKGGKLEKIRSFCHDFWGVTGSVCLLLCYSTWEITTDGFSSWKFMRRW